MKKYWEIFFYKIKLFLLYFIKFSENNIIISKKYPSNCVIKKSEKKTNHYNYL